jgi:hypothetical protein
MVNIFKALMIFLPIFVWGEPWQQSATIHSGNGEVFSAAAILSDSSGFISEMASFSSAGAASRHHIAPPFFDLNIYPDSLLRQKRIQFIQRGFAYALKQKGGQLYLHHFYTEKDSLVGHLAYDTLAGKSSEARLQRWYDALSFLKASPDADTLPWDLGISDSLLKKSLLDKIPIWLSASDTLFFVQFHKMALHFHLPVVYYPLYADPFVLGLDSVVAVVDFKPARSYLRGDWEAEADRHLLNYYFDFAVRIPQVQSFWEMLQLFAPYLGQEYSAEELLQLLTLQPAEFLNAGPVVLEMGNPANFLFFSDAPFSLKSKILYVIYRNEVIYGEAK